MSLNLHQWYQTTFLVSNLHISSLPICISLHQLSYWAKHFKLPLVSSTGETGPESPHCTFSLRMDLANFCFRRQMNCFVSRFPFLIAKLPVHLWERLCTHAWASSFSVLLSPAILLSMHMWGSTCVLHFLQVTFNPVVRYIASVPKGWIYNPCIFSGARIFHPLGLPIAGWNSLHTSPISCLLKLGCFDFFLKKLVCTKVLEVLHKKKQCYGYSSEAESLLSRHKAPGSIPRTIN